MLDGKMVAMKLNKGAVELASLLFVITMMGITLSLIKISSSADVTSQTSNVTSNASIEKNVAISLSTNLTAGVLFGNVSVGVNNQNATGNFNNTGNSSYWVSIDDTTNVPVDLCIAVNDTLRSSYENTWTIANSNYKYSWNASIGFSNETIPDYPGTTEITTSYAKTLEDQDTGGLPVEVFFRFNLDVPGGTRAGSYSNQVSFKATENITAC